MAGRGRMVLSPVPNLKLIAGLGVLLAFALLFALYKSADRRADKLQSQLVKCEQFRKDLAEQSERQKERTRTVIKEGEKRIVYVDRQAGKLESQPLQGNCATPNVNEWKELL